MNHMRHIRAQKDFFEIIREFKGGDIQGKFMNLPDVRICTRKMEFCVHTDVGEANAECLCFETERAQAFRPERGPRSGQPGAFSRPD